MTKDANIGVCNILSCTIYMNTLFSLLNSNIECCQILQDKHSNWMQDKEPQLYHSCWQ